MLVATKVKLSMERLARLNRTYGGKGSGRSPVRSDGQSCRSTDHESKQYTRSLVLRIVNSSSFISWLLSSMLQVTLMMVVHRQESNGCMDLTTPLGHETFRSSIDIDSESNLVCPF